MSVQHNTLSGADLHVAGYIDAADPGAIGYGKYWVDTTNGAGAWLLKVRNALNTGWESIRTPAESIAHGDLSDMPDTGGTNSDHDARYYTETESDARFVMLDQTTAQTITASPIFDWGTSTRIPYYSATKTLTDSANLTFDGTRLTNVDYIEFNDTDLNTKIGYQAGKNIVSGAQANTFVGNGAGTSAAVGGTNAADQNCAFGYQAFTANATGAYNTMLGAHVASARTSGNYNTMVGYYSNTAGIGTGDNNSCFGSFSGYGLSSGTNNTLIGYSAASMLQTGSGNVCLGYMAGNYETGSNAFYVDNQDRTNTAGDKAGALLYGVFNATPANQILKCNGSFTALNITDSALTSGRIVVAGASGLLSDYSTLTYSGTVISANPDTDTTHIFGRAKIGYDGTNSDSATLAHYDNHNSTGYALRQTADGNTILNAKTAGNLWFRINNATLGQWSSTGLGIGCTPATALDIDSNSNTQCLRLRGADAANEYADFYVTAANDLVIDSTGNTYLSDTITYVKDLQPETDNTYYLGKNDDDTPKAWKGVVLKDTTNGKYYRVEVINGTVTATDLTD